MTDRSPLVSVVTPFYNSERDLARCIESVLAQDHPSFEYVLVDNQSTDGSSEIARTYAEKDARIRLITTDRFLSQVENYNFALTKISAESRWVKMCQADDWLYPRCLVEMVTLGDASPTVGLVSSYSWRGEQVLCLGLPHDVAVLPGKAVCRLHLLEPIFLFGSPTTVLYRADLVRARSPFYEVGRLHEDTEVCFELLAETDFGFVHQMLSYRSVDPSSISGSVDDFAPIELDRLILVERYGHQYLAVEELERSRDEATRDYYRRLAERFLMGAPGRTTSELVAYQRKGLGTAGIRLSLGRLAVAIGGVAVGAALSPLVTARRIRQRDGLERIVARLEPNRSEDVGGGRGRR
jgi:glycosyltransferase involved in cell wall biosynthesis